MFYWGKFGKYNVLMSDLLEDLCHFFSTRDFVLSPADREDLFEIAAANRQYLIDKLSVNKENFITVKQTHSDNISLFTGNENYFDNCDAIITDMPDSAAIMNFADCVPIILFSKKNNIAAIVHAGWRGTAKSIVAKTVKKICSQYDLMPSDIIAAIGPSIGGCCFSVTEDVFVQLVTDSDKSTNIYQYDKYQDKYKIDLKKLNHDQLLASGVVNIDVCDYCTSCMSDIFFSYRKELGYTARHSAVVKLEKRKL